jgi:hypothetical protein
MCVVLGRARDDAYRWLTWDLFVSFTADALSGRSATSTEEVWMRSSEDVVWHSIRYAHVYANGWENGCFEARMTSVDPSVCARKLLMRIGGGNIVGVRILGIDASRVDYLILPERGSCDLV